MTVLEIIFLAHYFDPYDEKEKSADFGSLAALMSAANELRKRGIEATYWKVILSNRGTLIRKLTP